MNQPTVAITIVWDLPMRAVAAAVAHLVWVVHCRDVETLALHPVWVVHNKDVVTLAVLHAPVMLSRDVPMDVRLPVLIQQQTVYVQVAPIPALRTVPDNVILLATTRQHQADVPVVVAVAALDVQRVVIQHAEMVAIRHVRLPAKILAEVDVIPLVWVVATVDVCSLVAWDVPTFV